MKDQYASEEETRALIQPDTRTPAQKEAAKLADENWLNEQGMEAPPQRDWVGLTDDEVSAIAAKGNQRWIDFYREVEAKLKEKNT